MSTRRFFYLFSIIFIYLLFGVLVLIILTWACDSIKPSWLSSTIFYVTIFTYYGIGTFLIFKLNNKIQIKVEKIALKRYLKRLYKENHQLLISIISDLQDDTFRNFIRTDLFETIIDTDMTRVIPNEFGYVVFQYVAKLINEGYLYITFDKYYLSIEYDLMWDGEPIELIYKNYQNLDSLYEDILIKIHELFKLIGVIDE